MTYYKTPMLAALLLLSACAGSPKSDPVAYSALQKRYHLNTISQNSATVCRGYGCRILDNVTFSEKEMTQITRPLRNKAKNAADEREKLRYVIGNFELATGRRNGTLADKSGTYRELGDTQLDCVDESVNTTSYLTILQKRGLLKFHTVGQITGRTFFTGAGLPHQTAVIIDNKTGTTYALDSWFQDGGVPAEVEDLGVWQNGWHPNAEDITLEQHKLIPKTIARKR